MRRVIAVILVLLSAISASGQIMNHMNVDDAVFQRYAAGRLQQYSPSNIALADSIYQAGVRVEDPRLKVLGLALEMPVRFYQKEYDRMDALVAEIKTLDHGRPEIHDFFYLTMFDYCQYLVYIGRVSDSMLEARALERSAISRHNTCGLIMSYMAVGLIQRYRSNPHLAVSNFMRAEELCRTGSFQTELPNLYVLIAQEQIKLKNYEEAIRYCEEAEKYKQFFPTLRIKTAMTRAYLYESEGETELFWQEYDALTADPIYAMQVDADTRAELQVCYLRSKGRNQEALDVANSIADALTRYELAYAINADIHKYRSAYSNLKVLMEKKDSLFIEVQNEDMAVLDAEMNNAKLRAEAERLKARNQTIILLGLIFLFVVAFFAMLYSQWQLRTNLDSMRTKNSELQLIRDAHKREMEAKQMENEMRVRIIQKNKNNTFVL